MFSLLKDMRAVALFLASTLTILSNILISPALPAIEQAFSNTENVELMVRMLVTAPSLLVAIFAPFAGALADKFGRRRQLLFGIILFAISGSAGLWLNSLTAILISRLILGIAVAFVMTAQISLIGVYFAGAVRARFMGMQMAITNISGLFFVLLAGFLVRYSPFLPFAIYAIALLYLPVVWFAIKEPNEDKEISKNAKVNAEDVLGENSWTLTLVAAMTIAVLTFIGFYLIPTQGPFYLASIGHPSPTAAASLLALLTISGGAMSLNYGRIRGGFGRSGTAVFGFVLFVLGFVGFAVASELWAVLGAAIIVGAAAGLLIPIFISFGLDIAPLARRGFASGILTSAVFMGQFLSPITSHSLILEVGYKTTFGLTAGMFAFLACVAHFVFRSRPMAQN